MKGFYRHWKYTDQDGIQGCYEVKELSEDTEAGIIRVIFRPLYKRPNKPETDSLNRTAKNFTEPVERGGITYPERFRPITDSETIQRCKEAAQQLYG